jgi:predicted nucleic acid-binding protein
VILVDTSVWIDHLRSGEPSLAAILESGQVMMHPFVLGELACGNLANRSEVLKLLGDLPAAPTATDTEVLGFIENRALMGRGIGYIDVHLLAATALAGDAQIWTRDRRLAAAAADLGLSIDEEGEEQPHGEETQNIQESRDPQA